MVWQENYSPLKEIFTDRQTTQPKQTNRPKDGQEGFIGKFASNEEMWLSWWIWTYLIFFWEMIKAKTLKLVDIVAYLVLLTFIKFIFFKCSPMSCWGLKIWTPLDTFSWEKFFLFHSSASFNYDLFWLKFAQEKNT